MPTSKHGYPRPLILKNGTEVELRPLNPSRDAVKLLDFYSHIPPEDRWYLLNDVSDEQVVYENILNYDPRLVLPIVAVHEEKGIVGKATLYRFFPGARGHIANIRLVLDPWHRKQRLGTFMLLDLIQLAVNLGLTILCAQLIRGVEENAIRAARRLDFFEQAVLPDYVKDKRGNHYDLVLMVKRIHQGYDDY